MAERLIDADMLEFIKCLGVSAVAELALLRRRLDQSSLVLINSILVGTFIKVAVSARLQMHVRQWQARAP